MIKSLNFEIINLCNLKCRMCDIWENKVPYYFDEEDLKNILNSKYISKRVDITLTGGEPLIHKDIKNIVDTINLLGFKVSTISTNGILKDKIIDLLQHCVSNNYEIPNIHISLDGDSETNDLQRGIKGSFNKTIETIISLKKMFKDINIKIKYTITKNNIKTIKYAYSLSKKLGIDLSYKLVEDDSNYTNLINHPTLLDQEDKNLVLKYLNEIYSNYEGTYMENFLYYIKNNSFEFECKTPEENLFIMANGEVFACTKYHSIGNIKKENIDDILFNDKHKNLIKLVKKVNCKKCFSLHGAYKSII